jgi:undecaprenyl-diphosphatase
MNPDSVLFQWINSFVGVCPPLDALDALVRVLVTDYFFPTTMALALFALWFTGVDPETRHVHRRAVLAAILAVALCNALVKGLNLTLPFRFRPFADPALQTHLLFYRPSDSSFPSNPAAAGFTFAAMVWYFNRRAGALVLGMAVLFALARLYAGVHFPSDIVAGALIGILSARLSLAAAPVVNPGVDRLTETFRRTLLRVLHAE